MRSSARMVQGLVEGSHTGDRILCTFVPDFPFTKRRNQLRNTFARTQPINPQHFPWGKYDPDTGSTHHLEHHCADVAVCFEALLAEPVVRDRFDRASGRGGLDDVTLARLTVLAFLHDFGKICSGFQFKVGRRPRGAPKPASHLKAAFWACNRLEVCQGIGLEQGLRDWGIAVDQLLRAALAHHGRPVTGHDLEIPGPSAIWRRFRGYDPIAAGRALMQRAHEWFPRAFEPGPSLPESPSLAHLFAGTLAIADQVGSNEELFHKLPDPDANYIGRARKRAAEAVRQLSLSRSGWNSDALQVGFHNLFDRRWKARALQAAVAEAPLECPLLILESETGSGKTEAAIWRFAKLWKAGHVDGLYFALPTRAAAVQLHRRVDAALARVFPEHAHPGTVLAVPGYLRAGKAVGEHAVGWKVTWSDSPEDADRLARWSAESARKFLSAPAAVGTVDQALLSGLQVKWAHFRGSALSRSLLVVDEVHASDAYMTEVLEAVLRGHLEVGGHALLMSATLGSEARDGLIAPRVNRRQRRTSTLDEARKVPYPALTASKLIGQPTTPIRPGDYERNVAMVKEPILQDPSRIADLAIAEARRGGRVLVIRNTVRQAQAAFREVCDRGEEDILLQLAGGPALHHSRFAVEDRERLDGAVEGELGKGRGIGGRIVIGTQTLEQSLDIDADLLITDLCPVDVLLQRIGRLHRHESTDRPDDFKKPRCHVLVPHASLAEGELLQYGLGMSRTGGIYRDLRVLELTRRLIADNPEWKIPEMNRILVEEGTHREKLDALDREEGPWKERASDVEGTAAAERQIARLHILDRERQFAEVTFPAADEHVRTRLGDDGPRIVLKEPVEGPFGSPVTTFNLPAHLFRGKDGMPSREEIEDARAGPEGGGWILTVGGYRFWYGREGIGGRG